MRASSLHFAAPRVSAFGSTRFEVEVEVEVEAYAGLLRAQLRSDKYDMVISGSRSESEGVENVTVDSQKALFGRAAPTDVVCGCRWLGGPAYCNRRRTSLPRGFKFQASRLQPSFCHYSSHRHMPVQFENSFLVFRVIMAGVHILVLVEALSHSFVGPGPGSLPRRCETE